MDRQGIAPNLLIRVVVGVATLAGGGLILVAGVVALAFVASVLGIIS